MIGWSIGFRLCRDQLIPTGNTCIPKCYVILPHLEFACGTFHFLSSYLPLKSAGLIDDHRDKFISRNLCTMKLRDDLGIGGLCLSRKRVAVSSRRAHDNSRFQWQDCRALLFSEGCIRTPMSIVSEILA